MRGLAHEVGDATASTRRVDEPSDIQEIGDGDLASTFIPDVIVQAWRS